MVKKKATKSKTKSKSKKRAAPLGRKRSLEQQTVIVMRNTRHSILQDTAVI